jgi:hypothetical protein
LPRFDLVQPSYSRNRRLSSITSTIPPETILEGASTNVSRSSAEQIPASSEIANDKKGCKIGEKSVFLCNKVVSDKILIILIIRNIYDLKIRIISIN